MRHGSLLCVTIAALSLALVGVACDDDGSETSSSSSGTAGGGGTASSSTSGSAGSGGEAGCHGNAAVWDAIPKTNIPCTHNSDCCVVIQSCLAEGQVVSADDYNAASSSWPYCDGDCPYCIPPLVEVECVESLCVGYELPFNPDSGEPGMGYSHCGVDDVVLGLDLPAEQFSCLP